MQTQAPAHQAKQNQSHNESKPIQAAQPQFEDARPEAAAQLRMQSLMADSAQTTQLKSTQAMMAAKPNNTGLPNQLKAGIENLSGMSMDHVKVHYNSDKPAQLQAHAYAQGSDIHVAPGQEQHLPHEAWHVVQQAQGRVKPTMQMKDAVPVNDDVGLEHEADVMGAKALQMQVSQQLFAPQTMGSAKPIAQRLLMTHAVRGDSGVVYRPEANVGFINLYQQLMSDDPDVLVDGKPSGGAGVLATLKEAAVEGATIKEALANSIMASSSWKDLGNAAIKKDLAEFLLTETDTPKDSYEDDGKLEVDAVIVELGPDYQSKVKEWVVAKLKDVGTSATVAAIVAANAPKEWHEDLAQLVYDATKAKYYPESFAADPIVPPFKALLSDINSGAITEFEFVEKYGAGTNPGAEFKVKTPAPKRDFYDGKAVLHTHYGDTSKVPNYGHTKPYSQRYALGFGYTIVDLSKIKAVNDSKKKWSEL